MKVLYVSAYFAPAYCYGGPPRSIYGLADALINIGIELQVLSTTGNGQGELPYDVISAGQFEGVPVTYLYRSSPKDYFYSPEMKCSMQAIINDFDLVHIHGCWNYMSWMAGYICRKNNVPYVISPRGMLESEALKISSLKKRVAYSLIEKRQLKGAAYIHATSDKELASIRALGLDVPTVVIPNGIEITRDNHSSDDYLRKRLNISPDDFLILFVGRIHPIKGLDILCGALRLALRSTPNIRLALIGDGGADYVTALKNDFQDLIDKESLFFAGHLEGDEKADAYLSANVFVLMSHSENFGLAAAEAMSYGLPVILSKGCPWPQVEEWNAGYWIDASEQMVAEKILCLERNRDMTKVMGKNAKENILVFLDWKKIANKMSEVYAKTLS